LPDPPLTIFTTAYRNYAFDGFELGVIDFLLKPISFQRFIAAVDKVRDFLSLKTQNNQLEQGETAPESIFVKSGVKRVKLLFNEVMFIQGLKDYAIIHTISIAGFTANAQGFKGLCNNSYSEGKDRC